jgi:outer membrane murein-binding lipoprotein Lpp
MPIFSTAVISAVLGAFIIGGGLGSYAMYEMDSSKISKMSNDITEANALAVSMLKIEEDDVAAATDKAIKDNADLDKAHEAYIKTTNAYDIKLDTYRMYALGGQGCDGTASKGGAAGVPENSTSGSADADRLNGVVKEFSARLDRLINEKSKLSAAAYAYARDAHQFAFVDNCGIVR